MTYNSSVIPAKAGISAKGGSASGGYSNLDPRFHGDDTEGIYQRYLQAFKKGAYNYIKEETDPLTQQTVPRKYFSGGVVLSNAAMTTTPMVPPEQAGLVEASVSFVMASTAMENVGPPDAPHMDADEIHFQTIEEAKKLNTQQMIETIRLAIDQFLKEKKLSWEAIFSKDQGNDFKYILYYLMQNLEQHEYFLEYGKDQPLYFRIYEAVQPMEGIRLEFWGPGRHKLLSFLQDSKTDGREFRWFNPKSRPWYSFEAPASQGGMWHTGVSRMFDNIQDVGGSSKGKPINIAWREDKKIGGHIIAVHFPLNQPMTAQIALSSLADDNNESVQFISDVHSIGTPEQVLQEIQEMNQEIKSPYFPIENMGDNLIRDSFNAVKSNLKYVLAVDVRTKKIIGYVFFEKNKEYVYVSYLAVLPQYQRQKLGVNLMRQVFEVAGSLPVDLFTASGLNPAHNFYNSLPQHIPGVQMDYDGDGMGRLYYKFQRLPQSTSLAMTTGKPRKPIDAAMSAKKGGIDLSSSPVVTKGNDDKGIQFHIDPAQSANLSKTQNWRDLAISSGMAQWRNAPGVTFEVLKLKPISNLRHWLAD